MTKSLSNLIKSNYIYFNQSDKRVIDSDSRAEKFQPINFKKENSSTEDVPREFVEGIKTIRLDEIKETEQQIEQKELEILADAHDKARILIEEAKLMAEVEKRNIYEEAKSLGYTEGYNTAVEEVNTMKAELNNKLLMYKKDYEEQISDIEPSFAQLLVDYIKKLTGIMEEDYKEIIYYLIHQAVMGIPNCNHYTIRVSNQDYVYVEKQSQKLSDSLKNGVELNIVEDRNLSKNQCLIETDARTVDCSLNVQMENLITDLKLLAKI